MSQVGMWIAIAICACICGISFWTDSEIWATVVVKSMFTDAFEYDFSVKPLFNIILFWNYRLSEIFGGHPMILARILFALNTALVAAIFLKICKRINVNSHSSILALFLCVTNSFFIKRFGQVRSDVLAATIIMAFLWWLLEHQKDREKRWQTISFSLLALGLTIGITPKSLPLTLAAILIFRAKEILSHARKFRLRSILLGFVLALLAVIHLHRSWEILLDSIPATLMGSDYWDWARMEHVIRIFKENPLMVAVLAGNFGCAFASSAALPPAHRKLSWLATFAWIYLFVFPDRLPFFIASLLPLFFLPIAPLLQDRRVTPVLKTLGAGFGVFSLIYWGALIGFSHNFRVQLDYSNWARETYGTNPGLTIYDPVGVMPYSNAFNWYLGPAERGNSAVMQMTKDRKIDVIFYVQRLNILEPALAPYLAVHYANDGRGLFVRKIELERDLFKDDRLRMPDLAMVLQKELNWAIKDKSQPFIMEIRAGVINLTRFASLAKSDREERPFNGTLTGADTETFAELRLPPGATSILIYPAERQTPFSYGWSEVFRFDPEF
jgi:hypothetical protein